MGGKTLLFQDTYQNICPWKQGNIFLVVLWKAINKDSQPYIQMPYTEKEHHALDEIWPNPHCIADQRCSSCASGPPWKH